MPLTVYKFEVVEGQEWIFPADDDDYETFSAMDGRVIQDWIAPVMKLDTADRTYSDFPWLGEHVPILKRPAVDALAPALAAYGQLLPLKGEEVWLFNATTILDPLGHEQSRIVHFDDGDILDIEGHAFRQENIGTAEIFKLPMRASPVYITDHFVERIRRAGLRGVSFAPLWTSS
ncbi:imm11 family protein [Bosea sp. (in: a-proteobacteria)]|jgi:hypothetical protein|uniref:imm11 family protein n=1 Tax=Bosea sp. (in: a-proteobacteria) TaxID=1871050 RepID=UPI002DDD591C|nr:DUF1629 domain-containing protein [Bosea sp. (in: a-proteobacteria)]HEV2512914.1 DUF1629 domain-containing protein [Bosea sp. (in: a-proteobacteria)]